PGIIRYVLPVSVILSIVFSITLMVQFKLVESLLGDTNTSFFEASVDSSYDIIDTSINDSIRFYLKGIAETSLNHIVNLESSASLSEQDKERLIRESLSTIKVGKNGYAYLLDNDFKFIYHPYLQNVVIADSPYISRKVTARSSFIEYLWKNPDDEKAVEKVAYRLILDDGRRLGVSAYKDDLLYLIDLNQLKSKLEKHQFGESGYVYVLNGQGRILLHPDKQGMNLYEFGDNRLEEIVKVSKEQKQGTFHYDGPVAEIEKDYIFRYYEYLDWIIVAGIDKRELGHPVNVFMGSVMIAVVSVICIITSLVILLTKRHNKALEVQNRDYLTGLRNRRSFMELAIPLSQKAYQKLGAPCYSIIMIDIDLFKQVNDEFGHDHGDLVIHSLARILLRYESDDIISGRYGGEEFIVFLNHMSKSQATEFAESLRREIEVMEGLCKPVTASLGLYSCYRSTMDISQSITLADAALYQAKCHGRNQVIVSDHT
ncbi:diguanylate cyclase, partial [Vibrio makurazakiensis]|uniref:diguanylate cyclase n=1 Tax=Vibrio makurazakiensis TaxID=2910250 RepID=UPI003D0F1B90